MIILRFMQWITPSEKDSATEALEDRPWEATDQFLANFGPIRSIMFLQFTEVRFDFVLVTPQLNVNIADKQELRGLARLGRRFNLDSRLASHRERRLLLDSALSLCVQRKGAGFVMAKEFNLGHYCVVKANSSVRRREVEQSLHQARGCERACGRITLQAPRGKCGNSRSRAKTLDALNCSIYFERT